MRLAIVSAALLCLAMPAPAAAQDWEEQWRLCSSEDTATQIRACTAIIESGRAEGEELANAHNNRGDAYSLLDDYPRAIADFNAAIRLDRSQPVVWGNRGSAYGQQGDYRRGIADLDQAIRLNPRFLEAYGLRGAFHEQLGDNVRALADIREAIRLDTANAYPGLRTTLCRLLTAVTLNAAETATACAAVAAPSV